MLDLLTPETPVFIGTNEQTTVYHLMRSARNGVGPACNHRLRGQPASLEEAEEHGLRLCGLCARMFTQDMVGFRV